MPEIVFKKHEIVTYTATVNNITAVIKRDHMIHGAWRVEIYADSDNKFIGLSGILLQQKRGIVGIDNARRIARNFILKEINHEDKETVSTNSED